MGTGQTENDKSQTASRGGTSSKWAEFENAQSDIKSTFGIVPNFMNGYTNESLPGAWSAAKSLRFSSNTALELKLKGLISLAVASQIPCDRIGYFEEKSATVEGVSRQEQIEAVTMAAITRQWSTFLNGLLLDKDEFRKEVDKIILNVKKMMEQSRNNPPPAEMFLVKPTTPEAAYKDIEATIGLVPKFFQAFPKEGIAGAWSEFKALQLNPYTSLSGKQKELIGIGVASQIPCEYCVYFHRSAAMLNGATESEVTEAIAVTALARHWSTVFHGPGIDQASFKKDADQMLQFATRH
jgi:AhpD family alkylhydroperoxidase